tara:strand:+ start:312 stop:446 length:135 start_codon:yes stop_codon:yes gene_type:complete
MYYINNDLVTSNFENYLKIIFMVILSVVTSTAFAQLDKGPVFLD